MTLLEKYKTTIRFLTFLIFFLGNSSSVIFAQTTLEGKMTDKETGEEMIGGSVVVKKNGVYVTGISTDIDGNFSIKVEPGVYDIEVSYTGYQTEKVEGVVAIRGQATKVDLEIGVGYGSIIYCGGITDWRVPLNRQDETTSGEIITKSEITIEKSPTRNIQEMILISAGTTFQ